MPIEVGIWRLDGSHTMRVSSVALGDETRLEDILEKDISILGLEPLLILGRQVITDFGKRIDLFGVDALGTLYVIELKRDRTPREIVSQLLDYGSWLESVGGERVAEIFEEQHPGESFADSFADAFGEAPLAITGSQHRLIIVAAELDPSTERIVNYLNREKFAVPINAVFFRYFKDGEREYLVRSWLIDPIEAEGRAQRAGNRRAVVWNERDFYSSFGDEARRSWEDARRFGFVSGGGGRWYSQTLQLLQPGHRVFVCIPKRGYVGVGKVVETSVPVTDFMVTLDDGRHVPILEAPGLVQPNIGNGAGDVEKQEYLVRVGWIHEVPASEAVWEARMFANQNTACRLQGEKGEFTIHRLTERWGLADDV